MLNDLRNSERYALHGMAALVADDLSLVGHVADISQSGIALAIHGAQTPPEEMNKIWRCRIVSPELPEPMEFIARVVRPRNSRHGYGVACTITEIDDKNSALLDAFEKKRQQADSFH